MAKRNVADAVKIVLTGDQGKFAVTQINAAAKDFEKIEGQFSTMSGHLLAIGKRAEKDGKGKAEALYKEMCRFAEVTYKEEHLDAKGEQRPIKDLLPFWPVAKSQVLAGLKAGLKLADYKTVYEVVEATPKATRAANPTDGTTGEESGTVTMPKGEAGDALTTAYQRLNRTLKAIVVQKPQLITATAKALDTFVDSLEEMAQLEEEADAKSQSNNAGTSIPNEAVA